MAYSQYSRSSTTSAGGAIDPLALLTSSAPRRPPAPTAATLASRPLYSTGPGVGGSGSDHDNTSSSLHFGQRQRQASGTTATTRTETTSTASNLTEGGLYGETATTGGGYGGGGSNLTVTKHKRRMGTINNQKWLPQRLNFGDTGPVERNGPVRPAPTSSSHFPDTPSWTPSSSARTLGSYETTTSGHAPVSASLMSEIEPATPSQEVSSHLSRRFQHENSFESAGSSTLRTRSQPPLHTPDHHQQHHRQNQHQSSQYRSRDPPSHLDSHHHSTQPSAHALPPVLSMTPFQGQRQHGADNVIVVKGRNYAVLKTLGKGGSSVVYEAYDEASALRAIKKVDLSDADEAQAEGYLNEINLLERLQGHHRIVRMFDYEYRRDEDLLFVVMERGDTDLASLLKRTSAKHPITDLQRKFYWSEMLEAVQAIHKADVIHSDLKPANFLLVAGTLKLIDFGIASAVQSDKTSVVKDSQMGTFNFMSPEALEDMRTSDETKPRIKISRKSDVWSLGCILYNLTYGKLPFGHLKQPIYKLQAIIDPKHEIKYPASANVDPLLVDVIKRCLERDVSKRASVDELLQHPFLKSSSSTSSGSDLLSKLSNALTPNSRMVLSNAVKKLSSSDTDLAALKHLDLTA